MTGAALVALAGVILWHIQGFPPMPGQKFGPAWFPGLIAIGLAVCGALLVRAGLREHGALLALPAWVHRRQPRNALVSVLVGLLAYILLADALGFHLVGVVLLGVWMRMLGASWRLALPLAVIGAVAMHLAFYKLLRVPLPWGLLERFAF